MLGDLERLAHFAERLSGPAPGDERTLDLVEVKPGVWALPPQGRPSALSQLREAKAFGEELARRMREAAR